MPVMTDREYRNVGPGQMEARMEENGSQIVTGYATTFSQEYLLYDQGDFRMMESVDPHAFDECNMSDVIMQYDHEGRVFARTRNNTLQLQADEHGLHVVANLGETDIGRQLYQEISKGYTDKMSFGFRVSGEKRTEEIVDGVTIVHRVITRISKLFDVSAVSLPANDATEISARNLCEGVIAKIKEERLAEKERQRKIQRIRLLMEVEKNEH